MSQLAEALRGRVGREEPVNGDGERPVAREAVAEEIEKLSALDAISEPLQRAVRAAVPEDSTLKDLLSGTWLGHPLHPPLTDLVIGSWTSALLLDLFGGEEAEGAADRLVAAGILAAVPTAAAGLSDWTELSGRERRVGSVHAIGNTAALLMHSLSWTARRRGHRSRGVALSALGYGVASFSAWLGGHLSFGRGVGVNQAAFVDGPSKWTQAIAETDVEEDKLIGVSANGVEVLIVRRGGETHALADRCSHRGCALHEGQLNDDGTVTCPCHGSTFRLDGSLVKGPASSPQPRFEVRSREGSVEVKLPDA